MSVSMECLIVALFIAVTLRVSTETTDEDENTNLPYSPSTVYLQDIYTSKLRKFTNSDHTIIDEEEIPSTNMPTHVVEFHPKVLKISRLTAPPRVILNAASIKDSSSTSTENPYTDDTEEPMKVIPIQDQPRGVLDILFPSARVKTFKSVFDSVKKLLSHTFRR